MRLLGAVTEGSGTVNEDGWGFSGTRDAVTAAWVFDGVTGINDRNMLGPMTDAAWLVSAAHARLQTLAAEEIPLETLFEALVEGLIGDYEGVSRGLDLPPDYDPPAACLILVKRYGTAWQALRLGDSCLMAREGGRQHRIFAASPNNVLDHWLTQAAQAEREAGVLDIKALLARFAPELRAGRSRRNQPGGYSILECSRASLALPEFISLETPAEILLCTDGYFRAVDHYQLYDEAQLLDASTDVRQVLHALRAAETSDPDCRRYPRFKSADDATAVMLAL